MGVFGRLFRRRPAPPRVEPVAATPGDRAAATTAARRFMAARPDRLAGRFGIGNTLAAPREETRRDLRGLIAHARHAAQNIDYAKSYEMMVRRHVVGRSGIALQMRVTDPTGARDVVANRTIESAWADWGKRGNCTVCGRLSWWQVECIAATMLAREGNFLVRLYSGPSRGRFGFQIKVLSTDLLDLDYVAQLSGGAYVDGGIEFDPDGRVLAFHLFTAPPSEIGRHGASIYRERVPAAEVVHVYRPTEGFQALGVPSSHTALRRLNMLGQYEESALAAAHYGASQMLLLKSEIDAGPGVPGCDGAGDTGVDDIAAGSVARLPPGVDVANWAPNYPDGEMPGFIKSMLRGSAAGLGVSYSGLSSDMEGSNFSSLRDGRGEERDEWRIFQRDLWESFHSQVFDAWLPAVIVAGAVRLPLSKIDKFRAATWRGRGWSSVNPKDDATADEANLRNRLRAPSDIVAERGEDFEDLVARIRSDLDILGGAGLALSPALSGAAPFGAPAAPDDTPPPPDGAGTG